VAALPAERGGSAFVPVKLLELDVALAPPPSDVAAKPARQTRRGARRGAMEISLPNGAKVSLDAEVDAEALRRVLSALGVA
jgi:transposase